MKIIYDQETDTMTVIFKESSVEESDEAKTGIIIDYDNQGDIVSIEILDAKKRITQPTQVVYQLEEKNRSSTVNAHAWDEIQMDRPMIVTTGICNQ
jgi:uncharacterized protein YuzE